VPDVLNNVEQVFLTKPMLGRSARSAPQPFPHGFVQSIMNCLALI
jgi:hypothetical protein